MKERNQALTDKISYNHSHDKIVELPLKKLRRNPYQPRDYFDEEALRDLTQSISQHGVLQPIVVRETIKGYDIVVGERRFRASQLANKDSVPAIIKNLTDEEMLELAIIENLQRENLKPLEEAKSYATMMEELNLKQQDVADRLGKSRSYIANVLRLLNLPPSVKKLINEEKISSAHGRTLLGLDKKHQLDQVAKKVVKEHMSVRALEEYIKQLNAHGQDKKKKSKQPKPNFLVKHEYQLKEKFGTNIDISKTKKVGKISLEFNSEDEYKRILELLLEE
ncbi:plasmid partitioning protein ParB [Mammaliicoccus sciuri]|uniref:ParB/RepB/Spo0J family partition protein n=1 Tax=Mammaliicoccus sciuri TaxID=1296 RepID=UPI000734D255|nr:ParB/RepB/Spo0J family partition protein [Mammaliicoccus sciuri]OOV39256.1 chromosome partitioning protein ParB [Staphylococcus sp. MB371]KTT83338.1 plasmid partitioning protein ParB [Mammaliicoccus sciuri]KTT89883.1 plasmid partitioning protein ParB [Mammaliicoccus sciuri]KTT91954.1 plasmid partitioning protein ParB [Mammaliicoccus sciuri]KTT95553.1 plasmid partitioning protein ParB [Mammaliicoccus sciuri]